MLKKDIQFEDHEGRTRVEAFYFNLTRSEIIEMAVDERGNASIQEFLQKIIQAENNKQLIQEFKNFIMIAYGEREGDFFRKSEEISLKFTQHPAYDALFWELTTNDGKFAEFINGLIPKEVRDDAQEMVNAQAEEIKSQILNGPAQPTETPDFKLPPPAPTS